MANQTRSTNGNLMNMQSALKRSVLAKAKILQLYGWDESVAEEYCRPILTSGVEPESALAALDDIFEREQRIPAFGEVIAAARNSGPKFVWLTVDRQNVNGRTYTFARRIPPTDCVEDHIRVGESFVSVTSAGGDRMYYWHECAEGREFAKLWHELSGRKLGETLRHLPMENAQ